jgi:hypothetical protein
VRGDADFTAFGLEMMAAVNAERGNDERAARLHGAAAAIREEIDVPIHPESRARHEAVTGLLSDRLGERFASLAEAGATLTADDAVAEAMSRGPTTPATSLAASLQTLDDLLAR